MMRRFALILGSPLLLTALIVGLGVWSGNMERVIPAIQAAFAALMLGCGIVLLLLPLVPHAIPRAERPTLFQALAVAAGIIVPGALAAASVARIEVPAERWVGSAAALLFIIGCFSFIRTHARGDHPSQS